MPFPSFDSSRDRPSAWRRPWFALAALLVLAGATYSWLLGDTLRFPDEHDYLEYARHLLQAGIYSLDGVYPDALRPPGFSIVLAPFVGLFDSIHFMRVLQFVALAATLRLLAGLATDADHRGGGPSVDGTGTRAEVPAPGARTLAGADPNLVACAMLLGLAGYPVIVYSAGTLFPQTVIALMIAIVLHRLRFGAATFANAILIGLLAGFVAEISPTALTLVPIALAFAWFAPRWDRRKVVVVALCAALVPGAWLTRNLFVMDAPIVFSRNLAYNLDNAVLGYDPMGEDEVREPDNVFGYGAERLKQILGEPAEYLGRFVDFFAWRNDLHVAEEESGARDLVMLITYHALLALVLLRLALIRRARLSAAELAVIALYLATAMFHALVFARIRYRLPFDLMLFLPAANAVAICAGPLVRRLGRAERTPSPARR